MYYYLVSLYWFTLDNGAKEQRCESIGYTGANKRKADAICMDKNKKEPEGSTFTHKIEQSKIAPNNNSDIWKAMENVFKSLGRDISMQRIQQ